jgi:hypothetical protein
VGVRLLAVAKGDPIRTRVNRVEKVLADGGVDPVVLAANIRGIKVLVELIKLSGQNVNCMACSRCELTALFCRGLPPL